MKYLLYSKEQRNINYLNKNYVTFHRIDSGNWFFKNPFKCKHENFRPGTCLRCTDFIVTLEKNITIL